MSKGKVWCKRCDEEGQDPLSDFEAESTEDFPKVCPKCGSDEIFYQQIDWGKDHDCNGVKTGDGGCGGYRR